jgi:integrase
MKSIQDPPLRGDPSPQRRCRKARHLTIESALTERDRVGALGRGSGDRRPVTAYHCDPCSQSLGRSVWHVGHERRTPLTTNLKDLTELGASLASLGASLALIADAAPKPVPWDRFLLEVLPDFSPPFVSPGRAGDVRRVIRELGVINLAAEGQAPRFIETTYDLNTILIGRYIASRPRESPFTLRCRLMTIKTVINRALARGYLVLSPFADHPIRRLVRTGKPQNKRALTPDEVRRLFEVLRADVQRKKGWAGWKARRLLAAVAVAIGTGIRRNELLTLHVEDVDLEARVIRLEPRGPRGMGLKSEGSSKPVGMPVALVPIVREWLEWRLAGPAGFPIDADCRFLIPTCSRLGPWLHGTTSKRPNGRLKAAGRRAGIPDICWQLLRRTLATLMERSGAGRSQIQRQLRHSDAEVTEAHYIKQDEDGIAEAVQDVWFE